MSLLSSVLFFGHDELLLLTRGRLFELAGFRVSFAQELNPVSQLIRECSVDLLVLCHTLSRAECEAAGSIAEKQRIQLLRLLFTEAECLEGQTPEKKKFADCTFDWRRGPMALLEEACSMLRIEQRWTAAEALLAFSAKRGLA